MAEYPRYLTSSSVYAQDADAVDNKRGVRLIKASIYAKQAINWHPSKAPSRTFEPLNQAAVEQLDRLYKADLKRAKGDGSEVSWKPKPIPLEDGEAQATAKLEEMKSQIDLLTKRVEDSEKEEAEAIKVEKVNRKIPDAAKPKNLPNASDKSPA